MYPGASAKTPLQVAGNMLEEIKNKSKNKFSGDILDMIYVILVNFIEKM